MAASRFDSHAPIAFIVACVALLVCGTAFRGAVIALNLYLKKEPVDLRAPLSLIPTALGPWKMVGEDRKLSAEMIQELGTDKYMDRLYAPQGNPRIEALNVHVAYYTGMIDAVPHVPDRCLTAAGFISKSLVHNLPLQVDRTDWSEDPANLVNIATGKTYSVAYMRNMMGLTVPVRMPVGDLELRTMEFGSDEARDQRIFGGYFFIANGRVTPAPEGVKALAFNPQEKYAYYCKVQYIYASRNATQEKFLELVADHLKHLLPELMRSLPDWSEVERREQKDAESGAASSR
jgi:hypothetical protein